MQHLIFPISVWASFNGTRFPSFTVFIAKKTIRTTMTRKQHDSFNEKVTIVIKSVTKT